ncbi:MAG: hypothetical protein Kow0069_23630 [Promethearchaeota archaeon]
MVTADVTTVLLARPKVALEFLRACMAELEGIDAARPLKSYAGTLLARFLKATKVPPSDPRACAVAALYVASRHPLSHPHPETRGEFVERYGARAAGVEWFLGRLLDALGIVVLRDERNCPYYLDPEGMVLSVLRSLARAKAREALLEDLGTPGDGSCPGTGAPPRATDDAIVASVTEQAIDRMRLLPAQFRGEVRALLERVVAEAKREFGPLERAARETFF